MTQAAPLSAPLAALNAALTAEFAGLRAGLHTLQNGHVHLHARVDALCQTVHALSLQLQSATVASPPVAPSATVDQQDAPARNDPRTPNRNNSSAANMTTFTPTPTRRSPRNGSIPFTPITPITPRTPNDGSTNDHNSNDVHSGTDGDDNIHKLAVPHTPANQQRTLTDQFDPDLTQPPPKRVRPTPPPSQPDSAGRLKRSRRPSRRIPTPRRPLSDVTASAANGVNSARQLSRSPTVPSPSNTLAVVDKSRTKRTNDAKTSNVVQTLHLSSSQSPPMSPSPHPVVSHVRPQTKVVASVKRPHLRRSPRRQTLPPPVTPCTHGSKGDAPPPSSSRGKTVEDESACLSDGSVREGRSRDGSSTRPPTGQDGDGNKRISLPAVVDVDDGDGIDVVDEGKSKEKKGEMRMLESVRGKSRALLPATSCAECEQFFRQEAQGHDDPEKAYERLVQKGCRHRHKFERPKTPPGYWQLSFAETETQPPPPM